MTSCKHRATVGHPRENTKRPFQAFDKKQVFILIRKELTAYAEQTGISISSLVNKSEYNLSPWHGTPATEQAKKNRPTGVGFT